MPEGKSAVQTRQTGYRHQAGTLPIHSDEWLPDVMREAGRPGRTLWLMHEPPVGTPLSSRGSVVEGNPDWNTAIERFSPWLSIAGHDHLTPIRSNRWHHRLGRTLCVNAGQTDHGPLHYCVIEAEFAGEEPSLPTKMTVTAYPWNQTLSLPNSLLKKSARFNRILLTYI